MQFTKTLLTVMAAAFVVTAAPASAPGEQDLQLQARGCPNGWTWCGTCNGGDCKIALTNHKCDIGKCTEQSGGGDGKLCGAATSESPLECPGRG